jgi:hypothetical protein
VEVVLARQRHGEGAKRGDFTPLAAEITAANVDQYPVHPETMDVSTPKPPVAFK